MMDVSMYGHFQGDTFILNEPALMPGAPGGITTIDFSMMIMGPGLTREEVVKALLDPDATVEPVTGPVVLPASN